MISQAMFYTVVATMLATVIFAVVCMRRKKIHLIHKLYFSTVAIMLVWLGLAAGLRFVSPEDMATAQVLDALMYIGTFAPPLILLITIVFIKGMEKIPGKYYLLFIVPVAINVVVWTNPWHHLYYKVFSVYSSEVVFGPYTVINAMYSYACIVIAIAAIMIFAFKSKNRLNLYQALFFTLGGIVPIIVSLIATLKIAELSVAATPISYAATVLFHGFAIFQFHMLDLKPIAMQRVLDWISDGYMVIGDNNLVISFNKTFSQIVGKDYGIRENIFLQNCMKTNTFDNKPVILNLMAAIDTCRHTGTRASYEQAIIVESGQGYEKNYYVVEVSPIKMNENVAGFAAIFKDVSKVKESMQQLQESQARMMEQERLASLGHMIGGIAHNLKTPIMGISGSSVAMEDLIEECRASIGDEEVTTEDYKEIYGEMEDWVARIKEACSYMSDIITAVKGQAANINSAGKGSFTVSNLLKQVRLLLRHELQRGNCTLSVTDHTNDKFSINGDINNMVQVMNNLVSNAIDAMRPEGGEIAVEIEQGDRGLRILVKDRGPGVSPAVREKIFTQMITSKGTMGTGLGIYMSNSVIKAKFGGSMWMEDNPGGGAIFGICISKEYIEQTDKREEESR